MCKYAHRFITIYCFGGIFMNAKGLFDAFSYFLFFLEVYSY